MFCFRRRPERGNVLFLILIAIILFAALSYAVTQSSRGGGNVVSEKTKTGIAKIDSFVTSLISNITRISLINGVRPYDLYFNNDIYRGNSGSLIFSALGSPADPSLYVFHPKGGAVSPMTFTDLDAACTGPFCASSTTPGHVRIFWITVPGIGTAVSDLAVGISTLTQAICDGINQREEAVMATVDLGLFIQNVSPGVDPPSLAPMPSSLNGKAVFCLENRSGIYTAYWFIGIIKAY